MSDALLDAPAVIGLQTAEHRNTPRKPRHQEYVNKLAACIDERGPDEVPW